MRPATHDDLALVTVDEAARIAGVQPHTVRAWIRRRGLTTWRRPGRPLLLSELEVLEVEAATRATPRGRRRRADGPPSGAS